MRHHSGSLRRHDSSVWSASFYASGRRYRMPARVPVDAQGSRAAARRVVDELRKKAVLGEYEKPDRSVRGAWRERLAQPHDACCAPRCRSSQTAARPGHRGDWGCILLSLLCAAALQLSPPGTLVAAPSSEPDTPRFVLRLGVSWTHAQGRIAAGENLYEIVPGPYVDLEEDLAINDGSFGDQLLYDMEADWTFLSKNRVGVRLWEGKMQSEATMKRDFHYDDLDFVAGQHVRTILHTAQLDFLYDRRIVERAGVVLWGGAGIHYSYFNTGPDLLGSREDTYALMPAFHVEVWVPLRGNLRWDTDVTACFFALGGLLEQPADGSSYSVASRIAWRFHTRMGLEVGLRYLNARQRYAGEEPDHDFGDNRVEAQFLSPLVQFALFL